MYGPDTTVEELDALTAKELAEDATERLVAAERQSEDDWSRRDYAAATALLALAAHRREEEREAARVEANRGCPACRGSLTVPTPCTDGEVCGQRGPLHLSHRLPSYCANPVHGR